MRAPRGTGDDGAAPDTTPRSGIVLEGIVHAYGSESEPVVHGVDLAVAPGEIMCLLGPSGCGKTTTLRVAAGLERQSAGRVFLSGEEVAGPDRFVPPEGRRVGLMFQDYALFPHLKVVDNVAFGLAEGDRAWRRQVAHALLERLGLAGFAGAYPHVLSGGEQQRVALARALAPKPAAMLLDEPFSGLDQRLRDRVRDDTMRLLKEEGVPTLLVTHDAEEALLMADRIALMRDGRIEQVGPARALYANPASPFVARFFGVLNVFEANVESGAARTPIGGVGTALQDGCRVRIFVRAEAVDVMSAAEAADRLSAGEADWSDWVEARVLDSRLLGPSSLLTLVPTGSDRALTVRVADKIAPEVDETVRIRLDPSRTFVFPATQDV